MPQEIERKWLVSALPPDFDQRRGEAIDQGYLTVAPGGDETRIRARAGSYTLTTKSGSGLIRTETEIELSRAQFEALWGATAGRRITKVRHKLPLAGGLTLELDVYTGELAGLIVAEVEFEDQRSAQSFEPPGWFGADVTDDGAYKNHALAVHGRP